MATDIATAALICKRAELTGKKRAMVSRLTQMQANLVHLDAVLRMLDPDTVPAEPSPISRPVLDTLCEAGEPTVVGDLVNAVMKRSGMPLGDRASFLLAEKRVDRYVRRQEGRLVERVADCGPIRLRRMVGMVKGALHRRNRRGLGGC